MKNIKMCDIIIVGGGIVGLSTALGLAKSGYSVTVLDRQAPDTMMDDPFDGRASAIAYSSHLYLKALGLWRDLAPVSQPILEIRVSDGPSLMHLHFDSAELANETGEKAGPLGYMIENRHLRRALFKAAKTLETLTIVAPTKISSIHRTPGAVTVAVDVGPETNQQNFKASLLIGSDGRASLVRKDLEIDITRWTYQQSGIVAALDHDLSHAGIAQERFLPAGPFALLPLTGNRSSLVWTEKSHLTPTIMALSPAAFEAEIQQRAGDFLGKISVIGGRWSWPLSLQYAERYTGPRTALIGDAGHGIHPIAGQGLNLGLRDGAALIEVIQNAGKTGLDIGAANILTLYEQWRRFDNTTLIAVTDILNRLFSNDISSVRSLRDMGMSVVNTMPPLKKFFMSHARGTTGTLPRLLTGALL